MNQKPIVLGQVRNDKINPCTAKERKKEIEIQRQLQAYFFQIEFTEYDYSGANEAWSWDILMTRRTDLNLSYHTGILRPINPITLFHRNRMDYK